MFGGDEPCMEDTSMWFVRNGLRLIAVLAAVVLVVYISAAIYFWPGDDAAVVYDQANTSVLDLSYTNGLDAQRKEEFYHTSQGSEIFPIRFLRALTDPKTGKPFMQDLERFGLMPDPDRTDGLAVGLTLAKTDFTAGLELVGITCAACHTGEFRYNGKDIRVDGAPNMFDMQAFYADMVGAAKAVIENDGEMRRQFAERLFAEAYSEYGFLAPVIRPAVLLAQGVGLITHIDALKARLSLAKVIQTAVAIRDAKPECQVPNAQCTSGFGRLDAFNGTRNFILAQLSEDNRVELNAPSKFPPVWKFNNYRWVEWTLNTNSVMERNFTETMGAGATVKLDKKFGEDRFTSSIPARNMHRLEQLSYAIDPPPWPKHVFGPVNDDLVKIGGAIFAANCAGCHQYGPQDYDSNGLLTLRSFSLEQVGTDPGAALTVACPVPNPADLPVKKRSYSAEDATLLQNCKGVEAGKPFEGYAFAEVVATAVNAVKAKAYAAANVTPAEVREFEDTDRRGQVYWRDTVLEDGKPYAARPLHGVWAAAPYLHNGSVPTLHDLLKAPADRPKTFPIGHRDYDPVKVGFATDLPANKVKYTVDTTKTGNGNGGHLFGTTLPEDEKTALLEYLKTL
jgi:mono/diheme cytochrome c family protein